MPSNSLELAREHDLPRWQALGVFLEGLASAERGAPDGALDAMRHGAELLREEHALVFDGLVKIALAGAEARAGNPRGAVAILDEALATANFTGYRAFEAELHRVRGEMLLKRDPGNPAPAVEAMRTAVAVARQQATRSFELRAALSLAKLYRSTSRPVEAHDALAPALEGFLPTPEMPEIAEAQALLTALEQTDEVKARSAQRRRATRLHVAYGNALFAARGFGAPEMTEAFARARESASGEKDAPERLAADWGLWVGSLSRGEVAATRALAAAFLRDVEARPDSPEAGVAHRVCGITHWYAGEYVEARDHLERALALFQPGRDDDLAFSFGQDAGVTAMFHLAFTLWQLAEVEPAVSLVERAHERVASVAHIATHAHEKLLAAVFELMRGDLSRAVPNAVELAGLAREHDLTMYRAFGMFLEGWAKAENEPGGLEQMRGGAELLRGQNVLMFDGLIKIALAEAEARAGDVDRAMAILAEALATADRTGIARSTPNCIAPAAKSCSSAIRPTQRLRTKPSKPRSPSRSSKARVASPCAPRSRWPSCTNRPPAPSKRRPFSRWPSKTLRRRRKCPRSPRRRRFSRDWRKPIGR